MVLSKDITFDETNDSFVKLFLECYKGFRLSLTYDEDDNEYILGLYPIIKEEINEDNSSISFVYLSKGDINNTTYTAEQAYQSYSSKDFHYSGNDVENLVIISVINKMKSYIIKGIEELLISVQNSCPYCGIEKRVIAFDNTQGNVAYIEGDTLIFNNYYTSKAKIKYCPMCGKKLGGLVC